MLALEGAHEGAEQYALLNKIPSFATLSKPGVFISGVPVMDVCIQLWSSDIQKRIFGCSIGFSLLQLPKNAPSPKAPTRSMYMLFKSFYLYIVSIVNISIIIRLEEY